MTRRARRAPSTTLLVGGVAGVLALIAAGGFFFGSSRTPYRAVPEFPVQEYLSESGTTTLRGNKYRLSGAVLNSIAWSPSQGRLLSVEPNGSESPIPVIVPGYLGETNIQKGQRFHFLVEVREGGVLYATELTKS